MAAQLGLFGEKYPCESPVNVSSVPQRSPFRYPGGKTWLVPTAREWFATIDNRALLVEPFCGGGIIGLTAAAENYFDRVLLSEIDDDIASVWETMLGDECDSLARDILNFRPTNENLRAVLGKKKLSGEKRAFSTLLRNRTVHGGIMAKGSGAMKNGENGKGVFSRWYPETLSKRIAAIHEIKDKIIFKREDAFNVIDALKDDKTASFFIDPPYTVAGKRLYNHFEVDHERLFDLAARIKERFMMTYDDTPEIRAFAERRGFRCKTIPMRTTHLLRKEELVITNRP